MDWIRLPLPLSRPPASPIAPIAPTRPIATPKTHFILLGAGESIKAAVNSNVRPFLRLPRPSQARRAGRCVTSISIISRRYSLQITVSYILYNIVCSPRINNTTPVYPLPSVTTGTYGSFLSSSSSSR